jgi:hypothetical protein
MRLMIVAIVVVVVSYDWLLYYNLSLSLSISLSISGRCFYFCTSLSLDPTYLPNLQLTQRFVPCLGAEQLLGLP